MKGYTEIIEGMIDLLSTPKHWCKGILCQEIPIV